MVRRLNQAIREIAKTVAASREAIATTKALLRTDAGITAGTLRPGTEHSLLRRGQSEILTVPRVARRGIPPSVASGAGTAPARVEPNGRIL